MLYKQTSTLDFELAPNEYPIKVANARGNCSDPVLEGRDTRWPISSSWLLFPTQGFPGNNTRKR